MIFNLFLIKEFKKYPFFFILISLTLLLGIFGIAGIGVVSEQVTSKLRQNAKELLTSDLVVSARRELLAEEDLSLSQIMARHPHRKYQVIDIYSMVKHVRTDQIRLVEIRCIEEGFPFYGHLSLKSGIFKTNGLYLSQDLSDLWGGQVGDEFKVGEKIFSNLGIVTKDTSQGLRGFSLAPRIYLPLSLVKDAGLLKEGSTGSYARHFRVPNFSQQDFLKLQQEILKALPDAAIRVTLPQESSEQTARVLGLLTDFMSLAALIGLILSLVGIFYLYQSHLISRLKDFCLFHLYGLSKKDIVLGVIGQFSIIFFSVVVGMSLLLIPIYEMVQSQLSSLIGMELATTLNLFELLKSMPFLYLLGVTILIPLLMGLLRTPMGAQLKAAKISLGTFRFYDFSPFFTILLSYSVYLSHSFKIGSLFFVSILLVLGVSTLVIKVTQIVFRKIFLRRPLNVYGLEIGLASRHLIHSGHKLTLSFLSLALGTTLISLVLQLDSLIQKEFTLDEKKPSLFLFDIQEEQLPDLLDFSRSFGVRLEGVTPLIRGRLDRVNGMKFTRVPENSTVRTREDEVESRTKNRGINLTYRAGLSPSEKLLEGEDFSSSKNENESLTFVSLEERFAKRMGLKLGDKITFDIQGVEIEGIVKNLREVKWTSFYPNFFVNLSPGAIDEAPKTFLAVLPKDFHHKKHAYQREIVRRFPNVSLIDVEELMLKLSSIFEKARQAIELISWLSLIIGLVILYGLSHDQVYRRYFDIALLKSLGLTAGQIRKQLIVEFGFLFILAASVGFLIGWLIAITIGIQIFKLSWSVDLYRMVVPAVSLSIMCLVTILVASWRAVAVRPRELLSDS